MSNHQQLPLDHLWLSTIITDEAPTTNGHTFPIALANQLAAQEVYNKHLFRPNTYLHKWWARRCGTTFRLILKQFAATPAQNFYHAGGLEGKIVLDPMMGGGTTLHEAIRMGANVIGVDIDPIPVVQLRTALSDIPLSVLQQEFDDFFAHLHTMQQQYHITHCPQCHASTETTFTLYGIQKRCACEKDWIQVDRYVLREEADRVVYLHPDTGLIETADQLPHFTNPQKLLLKQQKQCPTCHSSLQDRVDLPYYQRLVPLAIFGNCDQHATFIKSPDEHDCALRTVADAMRPDGYQTQDFRIEDGPKSKDLLRRNITHYSDLFSSRQLMYLDAAIQRLNDTPYESRLHLAMLVSTSLEFNALLSGYKGWQQRRAGAIRHVFTLHAYSFPYTVLENNPINSQRSSGNLQRLFQDRVVRARKWAQQPIERLVDAKGKTSLVTLHGERDSGQEVFDQAALQESTRRYWLIQDSATQLPIDDQFVDLVVTDPPYFDSVQYSNLAAFFRVWLQKLLPDEVNWFYDEQQSAVANTIQAPDHYGQILGDIFKECYRVLKPHGRMAFTYHHWDAAAWAQLTRALKESGFCLTTYFVVVSEHPISVHINNLKSIQHDAILVLARCEDSSEISPALWPAVTKLDTTDSEAFCAGCAAALGWLLQAETVDADYHVIWKGLLA